jgi:murein DD-endopeptidase MepM/ murein hydrolase activator NlpD
LKGTEIVLDHGDGLKTVYRFVIAVEGLSIGDSVKQGDCIATVADPTGDEYKDGAHLHFEILENGNSVDPTGHLTFEEK